MARTKKNEKEVVSAGNFEQTNAEPIAPMNPEESDVVEETEKQEVEEEKAVEETTEVAEINPQAIIEEFSEAAKEVDKIVTESTSVAELNATLERELERANNVESQLQQHVEKLQQEIEKQTTTNKTKRGYTNFWSGVSEGWFN